MNPFKDPALHTMIHDTNSGLGLTRNALKSIKRHGGNLNAKQVEMLDLAENGVVDTLNAIDAYYIKRKEFKEEHKPKNLDL